MITVALNYQNIRRDQQRISKIKSFIHQYDWQGIKFPSNQENWKSFEQNNKTIAVNVLYVPHNTETIRFAYKSSYNNKHKNQVILLTITDNKKRHCLALKSERMFYNS